MILGDLRLPTGTVKGLNPKDGWTYATHAVIEGKPRRQFVAPDGRAVSLSLFLHAEYINPQQTIDRLRSWADASEVLVLQADSGVLYGQYVIESIDVRPTWTLPDETIVVCDVEVSLGEPGLETLLEVPTPEATEANATDTVDEGPTETIPEGEDPADVDPAEAVRW